MKLTETSLIDKLVNLLTREFDIGRYSDRFHGEPNEMLLRRQRAERWLKENVLLTKESKNETQTSDTT